MKNQVTIVYESIMSLLYLKQESEKNNEYAHHLDEEIDQLMELYITL